MNDQALDEHARRREGVPQKFTETEASIAQHLCGVLYPWKLATKSFEDLSGKHRASILLPTVCGLMQEMQPATRTPLPPSAGTDAFRNETHLFIAPRDLHPLAARTKEYLLRALQEGMEKYFDRSKGGNEAFRLYCVCSFLDPRYKDLHFLSDIERTETHKATKKALLSVASFLCPEKTAELQSSEVGQVKEYIEMHPLHRHLCPLNWWREQEEAGMVGSCLAMLARYCFSIPGSSPMPERAFGTCPFGHGGRFRPEMPRFYAERIFVHENLSRGIF